MSQIKHFVLNGNSYYTTKKITVLDIINYFNYSDSLLVLELNKVLCNRTKWNETFLNNNDKIEIVTIVGGG